MHFNGVIGDLTIQYKKAGKYQDQIQELILRYEAIEGLQELIKNFQVVLYSMYSEALTNDCLEFFKKNEIEFDAVYCRDPSFT